MSSSDNTEKDDLNSDWQPLVPSDLESYDKEAMSEPDPDDPDIAKAFKVLYEREQLPEEKRFSLLYGPRSEVDAQKEAERLESEPPPEVEEEVVPEHEEDIETEPPPPDYEAIAKQAYDEGFAKGEAEGYEAGVRAAEEKTERIIAILSQVEGLWSRIIKQYEQDIIRLVARVAEKVVYGTVATDREIITRAILDAFEQIPDPVNATITVHPDDYEYIEVVKEDFFEHIQGLKQVSIVSDPLINIGGCRIETASGEVDTSIEDRLEAVRTSIIETAMTR